MSANHPDLLNFRLEKQPTRVYAFVDGVGGFWEGQTTGYNTTYGGYTLAGRRFLIDFIWRVDGVSVLHDAPAIELSPDGLQRTYDDYTETLTVLRGKAGFVVRLQLNRPRSVQLIPAFLDSGVAPKIEPATENELHFADLATGQIIHICGSALQWVTGTPGEAELPTEFSCQKGILGWLDFGTVSEVKIDFIFQTNEAADTRPDISAFRSARANRVSNLLAQTAFSTNLSDYDRALQWCLISGNDLLVQQNGPGLWAGLPWFHQCWGRDTFIALPGICLVAGQFTAAQEIISNFAQNQKDNASDPLNGRIPNRIASPTDIIYNTTDATPWFIREIYEYICYTGDLRLAEQMFPIIKRAIDGAKTNFVDKDGFLTHDLADTWMDARIQGQQAWSPRGNRAVEIQALWFTQLKVSARIAHCLGHGREEAIWQGMAAELKANFMARFYDPQTNALYDHLTAADAPNRQIRPNQIFALTVPLLADLIDDPAIQHGILKQVVTRLTYPHGLASLDPQDDEFHPYHHGQIYHFDAAYHNGLCWQWLTGPVISALVRFGYENLAFALAQNLADQILNTGMPGSLTELVEPLPKPNGKLQLTGAYSQAWSVAEFVRNFQQDFLGIQPNMLTREIGVAPRLPERFTKAGGLLNIGRQEQIRFEFTQENSHVTVKLEGHGLHEHVFVRLRWPGADRQIYEHLVILEKDRHIEAHYRPTQKDPLTINHQTVQMAATGRFLPPTDPALTFAAPQLRPDLPSLSIPNYLEQRRLSAVADKTAALL